MVLLLLTLSVPHWSASAYDIKVGVGVHLVQPLAAQPAEISAASPTRDLTINTKMISSHCQKKKYHLVAAVILLYGRVTVWTLPGVTLDVVLTGQGARHHLQPLLSEPEGYDKITTMFCKILESWKLTSSQGTICHPQSWSTCQ